MESPSSLDKTSSCYSSFKSRTTMKSLLGISRNGVVSFCSDFYCGSIIDPEIVKQSGYLTYLSKVDLVTADKGFVSYGTTWCHANRLKGDVCILMPSGRRTVTAFHVNYWLISLQNIYCYWTAIVHPGGNGLYCHHIYYTANHPVTARRKASLLFPCFLTGI